MYIQLQADTQEIIDEARPMICFFCVPKDTENVRANIRGLITQLFKARNYEGPGRYKYTADSLAGIEVCFMSEECFSKLIENTEEIALGIKNLVALLGEDKTIYHRWPKPALPTTETPNPTLTVDRDSVFQATRYLDPLAIVGQKFTIADIVATATTDAVVKIDPVGMNTLALEAKADKANDNLNKIRVEVEKIDPRLETTNTYLGYLYQAFYAGVDIMPLIDQSLFVLMRNALFNTGWLTDESHLRKHNQLLENGLFQSSTISYSNSWLAKLNKISDIYAWLTSSDGVLKLFFANVTQIKDLLDYHLGEVQYGIKHFFNIFAVGKFDANLNFFQTVKKHWDKPNTEDELQLLQNSIFQNNPDYAGRGFTLYDWLTMWVKPHGTNWQGNGYVNPATNRKGHELVNLTGDISDKLHDISSPIDTFVGYFGLTGKFGAWWSSFLTWWTTFQEWWLVFSVWFQAEFIAGFTAIVASIVGLAIKQGVSLVGGWLDYWLGFIGGGEGEPPPQPDTTLADIKTILGNMRSDTQAIANNSGDIETKLQSIKDTLFSGLMFSGSLSILTLINNSLQSIWGVLRVDLSGINSSLTDIADKDCCNSGGTTTVTNPDGSQTTTPIPITYPNVDPSLPYDPITNPTTGPYNPITLQQPTDNRHDEICGYAYRTLSLFVTFFNDLNARLKADTDLTVGGVNFWAQKIKNFPTAIDNVWLNKLSLAELRNLASKFNVCEQSVNFPYIDDYVTDNMEAVACFEYGDTITNQQILNRLSAELVADNVTPPFIDYILYTAGLWYKYGLFQPDNLGTIAISNWAQFCPCVEPPPPDCTCGDPWAAFAVQDWPTPSQSVVALRDLPEGATFEVQYYDMAISLNGIGALDCVKDCKFDWAGGTVQPEWDGGWNPGGLALMNAEPSLQNNTSIVSWSVGTNSITIRVGIYRKTGDNGNFIRLTIVWLGTCQQ